MYLFIYVFIYVCMYLFIYSCIYLFIYLFIYLLLPKLDFEKLFNLFWYPTLVQEWKKDIVKEMH